MSRKRHSMTSTALPNLTITLRIAYLVITARTKTKKSKTKKISTIYVQLSSKRSKIKCSNIYIPPLTEKHEQQRFTVRSGVLTSTSIRCRGAVSGSPLPERTDFGPAVRQTNLRPSQPHCGLHPAMFSGNDSLF